jgi:nicotinamidase-related amidase
LRTDQGARLLFDRLQALIDGAKKSGIPIVQVFHVEEDGVFSLASGHVKTLQEISITPDIIFQKNRHSALVGSGLGVWLVEHRIQRLESISARAGFGSTHN